jgi:hypothetical protein
MPNRRSPGKLEAKLARNYCYENSEWRHRNNDPNEIGERSFKGTPEQLIQEVLSKLPQGKRTGSIPDYPQGLVIADQVKTGFFNVVTLFDETYVTNIHV